LLLLLHTSTDMVNTVACDSQSWSLGTPYWASPLSILYHLQCDSVRTQPARECYMSFLLFVALYERFIALSTDSLLIVFATSPPPQHGIGHKTTTYLVSAHRDYSSSKALHLQFSDEIKSRLRTSRSRWQTCHLVCLRTYSLRRCPFRPCTKLCQYRYIETDITRLFQIPCQVCHEHYRY
jgi:hypothetical protein